MSFAHVRLGRAEHQPDKLARAPRFIPYATMIPPSTLVRDYAAITPGLYQNDVLGDCTAVALANAARLFSRVNVGADIPIEPDSVPRMFAHVVGWQDMATLANCTGTQIIDMLAYQELHGFDIGQQVDLVAQFAVSHDLSPFAIASIMATFGVAYLGVALSVADQTATVWDTGVKFPNGDPARGSWGRHALVAYGYDGLGLDDHVMLGTWGVWQPATWRWLIEATDEVYAVMWRQLMAADTQAAWQGMVAHAGRLA